MRSPTIDVFSCASASACSAPCTHGGTAMIASTSNRRSTDGPSLRPSIRSADDVALAFPSNAMVHTSNGLTHVNASGPAPRTDGLPSAPMGDRLLPSSRSRYTRRRRTRRSPGRRAPPSSRRPLRHRCVATPHCRGRRRPRNSPNPASPGCPVAARTCIRAPRRCRRSGQLPCEPPRWAST